jgi:hypothetical protein
VSCKPDVSCDSTSLLRRIRSSRASSYSLSMAALPARRRRQRPPAQPPKHGRRRERRQGCDGYGAAVWRRGGEPRPPRAACTRASTRARAACAGSATRGSGCRGGGAFGRSSRPLLAFSLESLSFERAAGKVARARPLAAQRQPRGDGGAPARPGGAAGEEGVV